MCNCTYNSTCTSEKGKNRKIIKYVEKHIKKWSVFGEIKEELKTIKNVIREE